MSDKDERSVPRGNIETKKYGGYYDVSNSITTALATNPNNPDHPNYNTESVFQHNQRNSEKIHLINDGTDTLFVLASHGGYSKASRETPVYPGENKTYYNIFEFRLRSPTIGNKYRVTEYPICKCADAIYGSSANVVDQDPVTNSLSIIQHPHEDIHDGNKYMATDLVTGVGAAATQLYLLTTPNTSTRIHMLFGILANLGVKIQFFETPTITTNGTAMDAMNQNRNSSNVASLLVFKSPTVTGNGTQLHIEEIGSSVNTGKNSGFTSADRNEHEWVLKQNTSYLLLLTAVSNSTDITTHFHWYEI